jgi:cytochrome c553
VTNGALVRPAAAVLAGLALVLAGSGELRAGDPATGREKAKACVPCHGLDGVSKQPDAPNIAGQVEMYLATQLRHFRSGERKSEIMNIIAQPLSDDDITNLAAYYAGIQVSVTPPE